MNGIKREWVRDFSHVTGQQCKASEKKETEEDGYAGV